MKRVVKGIAAAGLAVVILCAGGLAVFGLPLTDLRPPEVSLGADPPAADRAAELLAQMGAAHGIEALAAHKRWTMSSTDTWQGVAAWMTPWPTASQRLTQTAFVHTFNSSVRFEEGPALGHEWGIEDGKTWTRIDGTRVDSPDSNIAFMLPTVQYFTEMPQRLSEAPVQRYVGTRTVNGIPFDVVYLTWESVSANADFDQYLLYLDSTTHHLRKVHYTVRDAGSFIQGVAHFEDLRTVDGYHVPFDLVVTSAIDDSLDDYLHRMVVHSFAFVD